MEGLPNYLDETRPWGSYERFTLNDPSTVKLVEVNPNEVFSLQTHAHRDEFWRVVKGEGVVHVGDTSHAAREGSSFFIPRGTKHRAEGGPDGLTLLEISFGQFDEADITHLEDEYGRL